MFNGDFGDDDRRALAFGHMLDQRLCTQHAVHEHGYRRDLDRTLPSVAAELLCDRYSAEQKILKATPKLHNV